MRKLLITIALSLACLLPDLSFALERFQSEAVAQKHCPLDVVVWLNNPTGVWHYKGQRWYGRTKDGAYVCKKEAAKDGNRGTKNGQ